MLLKEDGHLDIEKVEKLNEEELDEEMESWGPMQLCEWEGYGNFITLEEFGEKYHRIIRELWHEDEEEQINTETKNQHEEINQKGIAYGFAGIPLRDAGVCGETQQ